MWKRKIYAQKPHKSRNKYHYSDESWHFGFSVHILLRTKARAAAALMDSERSSPCSISCSHTPNTGREKSELVPEASFHSHPFKLCDRGQVIMPLTQCLTPNKQHANMRRLLLSSTIWFPVDNFIITDSTSTWTVFYWVPTLSQAWPEPSRRAVSTMAALREKGCAWQAVDLQKEGWRRPRGGADGGAPTLTRGGPAVPATAEDHRRQLSIEFKGIRDNPLGMFTSQCSQGWASEKLEKIKAKREMRQELFCSTRQATEKRPSNEIPTWVPMKTATSKRPQLLEWRQGSRRWRKDQEVTTNLQWAPGEWGWGRRWGELLEVSEREWFTHFFGCLHFKRFVHKFCELNLRTYLGLAASRSSKYYSSGLSSSVTFSWVIAVTCPLVSRVYPSKVWI